MKIAIAGAGIQGLLLAFYLVEAGYQVTLFDKSDSIHCSRVAAGLLTPVAELDKGDALLYPMSLDSLQHYWPNILQKLSENIYFQFRGSLFIAHPRDHRDLRQHRERIIAKMPDSSRLITLNQSEITRLEPDLAHFQQGFYTPDEGQLDSQHVMDALEKWLLDKSVSVYKNTFVQKTTHHTVQTETETYRFDWVIDTRGLGAREHFSNIRSMRGELIWLHAPRINITLPIRFLHPRYALYIAPRPRHHYIIGASEIETEDYAPITVHTMLELLTASFAVHSGFKDAHIVQSQTQCRPVLPHHKPEIRFADGLIAINGLYRQGYSLAPTLAVEVLHFLQTGHAGFHYPQLWRAL